jgi:hypothetical protein
MFVGRSISVSYNNCHDKFLFGGESFRTCYIFLLQNCRKCHPVAFFFLGRGNNPLCVESYRSHTM